MKPNKTKAEKKDFSIVDNTQETIITSKDESIKLVEPSLKRLPPPEFINGQDGAITIKDLDHQSVSTQLFETTGISEPHGALILINQVVKAHPYKRESEVVCFNATSQLMHELSPKDALEGLLTAQMVTTHNIAMEFSRRALTEGQTIDGIDRNINRATKLMNVFTRQMEALQKHRTQGQQKIIVQHQNVQVNNGGQAIIGDVHNEPGEGRGNLAF